MTSPTRHPIDPQAAPAGPQVYYCVHCRDCQFAWNDTTTPPPSEPYRGEYALTLKDATTLGEEHIIGFHGHRVEILTHMFGEPPPNLAGAIAEGKPTP